ncbi:hypothetical protein HYH03_008954 [Edaphochlamys debaryana]|uniref:F-box domain-containing protein n=1 Tax=Edaphochlamys debaryana TaxID=47281 RepID=A0A835XZX5_9CHLO|nr:hypothetical protein HYH03_008954 [Edaphochlamys debaryana]|eukprot:KAG2492794.1 hypothetical protein HYH03_008954 [Edaphochlamys debaryana]
MPSSVRPRNPNQKATWNDLPLECLKIVCQTLEPEDVLRARRVAKSMRDACSSAPVVLRLTLPMQRQPWLTCQLEGWEKRINGLAEALASGRIMASHVQLRMEGAEAWAGEESMPAAQVQVTSDRLQALLSRMAPLGEVLGKPITRLDVDLPITLETLMSLFAAFPDVTDMRLDSLIPPPHNHVQVLADSGLFPLLERLDVLVTAWDQLQHLAQLTHLTHLTVRYRIWNIPELTPLFQLQRLETFNFEALDDRGRFQLDFLAPLVRNSPCLKQLRVACILPRTTPPPDAAASCDFLSQNSSLNSLDLDLRVPPDAARTAHVHLRHLNYMRPGCKARITIRADSLPRESSFESSASATGPIPTVRVGMPCPGPVDWKERWGALNIADLGPLGIGHHKSDALQLLHLRGYRAQLSMLPDLSAANLRSLQISDACLGPADFLALSTCTSLEQLFLRFSYRPDPPSSSSSDPAAAGGASTSGAAARPGSARAAGGRGGAATPYGILTRSRRSSQSTGRHSSGAAAVAALTLVPDCTTVTAPYALQPLLELQSLKSLELLEEAPRPRTGGVGERSRRSVAGAAGPSPSAGAGAGAGGSAYGGPGPGPSGPRRGAAGAGPSSALAPGAAAGAGAGAGAGPNAGADPSRPQAPAQPQPQPQASSSAAAEGVPMSRASLNHFVTQLGVIPPLETLHVRLLADPGELPECPCPGGSCFAGGSARVRALAQPLTGDILARKLRLLGRFRVELGGGVAAEQEWFRPGAWPALD